MSLYTLILLLLVAQPTLIAGCGWPCSYYSDSCYLHNMVCNTATGFCACKPGYTYHPYGVCCTLNQAVPPNPPHRTRNKCSLLSGEGVYSVQYSSFPPVEGGTATASCNNGNRLVGPATVQCLAGGTWSGRLGKCKAMCPSISVANGDVTHSSHSTVEGVTATVTCRNGYRLVGSATAQCLAEGTWSSRLGNCKATCPPLSVANGDVTHSAHPPVEGVTATVTCSNKYWLDGVATVQCLASGIWAGDLGKCKGPSYCSMTHDRCADMSMVCNYETGRCGCKQGKAYNENEKRCVGPNYCSSGHDRCAEKSMVCNYGTNQCGCRQGEAYNENEKQCVGPNYCSSGHDRCAEKSMICNNGTNQCACRQGEAYNENEKRCVGDKYCSATYDHCKEKHMHCNRGTKQCECNEGEIFNEKLKVCVGQ